jgi:hypothetical protein
LKGERKMEEIWVGLSHKPISFSQKSARLGLRIPGVYQAEDVTFGIKSLIRNGELEHGIVVMLFLGFGGPVALGGGLTFTSCIRRCLKSFLSTPRPL